MISQHVGREQRVEALGRDWILSRWDRNIWAKFIEWAEPKIPDPRKQAADFLKMVPATDTETRDQIVRDALDRANVPVGVNHPGVLQLLNGMDGTIYIVHLLLKDKQPDSDLDDAYNLVLTVGQAEMAVIIQKCAGLLPTEKKSLGSSDPTPGTDAGDA